MKVLVFLLASSALLVLAQTAAVTQPDCRETFQSQMSKLLAIKESCASAAPYDCCQVGHLYLCMCSYTARKNLLIYNYILFLLFLIV